MLVTFKSKAAADVLMYKEHAKRMLDLLGKDIERGVISTAETGPAIARLEQEIAEIRAHATTEEIRHDVEIHQIPGQEDHEHEPSQPVSFATRVYPLLEMLRAAHREGHNVAWGI
ncbi:DUF1840 domain-containing protein [Lacisediminimonas sp.]|uniref:DUF1840 domain-containing protein n=1 Tax=Lacisediminimonas sp. TaxID=3060582 RepID=UPI0027248E1F|nr:DUF1840 domain-containing protein [Lacisediminimonas sp.]MDO8300788.1 DUF1840 domain-containing protein [Lacisediminimonas sp.]